MKRIIALVLFFGLCFSCVASSADKTKELTFQGIPWYSSPKKTYDLLWSKGFLAHSDVINVIVESKILLLNAGESYKAESNIFHTEYYSDFPYTTSIDWHSGTIANNLQSADIYDCYLEKTIAKQQLSGITIYFTSKIKKPQLIECDVGFASGYDEPAILKALISAYGKPNITRNEIGESIWVGDKNTVIFYCAGRVVFATLDGLKKASKIKPPASDKGNAGF